MFRPPLMLCARNRLVQDQEGAQQQRLQAPLLQDTKKLQHTMRKLCMLCDMLQGAPLLLCACNRLVQVQEGAQQRRARQLRPRQQRPKPRLQLTTPPAAHNYCFRFEKVCRRTGTRECSRPSHMPAAPTDTAPALYTTCSIVICARV